MRRLREIHVLPIAEARISNVSAVVLALHERPATALIPTATARASSSAASTAAATRHGLFRQRMPHDFDRGVHPDRRGYWRYLVSLRQDGRQSDFSRAG